MQQPSYHVRPSPAIFTISISQGQFFTGDLKNARLHKKNPNHHLQSYPITINSYTLSDFYFCTMGSTFDQGAFVYKSTREYRE